MKNYSSNFMLQNWFANHCNGIWEHQFGIQTDTLDNPGWMLTIDLNGTQLESQPFEEIDFEESSYHWIQCNVNQKKFQGFGGALNLENLIEIFISWSENIELHMNSDKNHLSWMQNWYQSQCNGDWERGNRIKITTIDNPGWGVTISLDSALNEEKIVIVDSERTQDNWCYCVIKNNNFEGNGGIYNLIEILNIFNEWTDKKNASIEIKNLQKSINNNLNWIANWFDKQCDGDWEHENGIKITTIDNPGWSVSIDLFDTNLEGKEFDTIKEDRSENDWFICFVVNKKFESRCGPRNLSEVLRIFRSWAEGEFSSFN